MSRQESRNRMFPVGLYGVLLFGLFGVTFPSAVAPIESLARTIVCLPLRAYSLIGASGEVVAAPHPSRRSPISKELAVRVLDDARGPSGYFPQVLRVRWRERGPTGTVDELVLDTRLGELRGCARPVTVGRGLIGWLDVAGSPDQWARVRMLHYRSRRVRSPFTLAPGSRALPIRVAAQTRCAQVDAQGTLRLLVEPSRSVDPWPLRCTLLDDSYLASRLRRSGGVVTTIADHAEPDLPGGLTVGRLMVWGYPSRDIPVGLFVEPVIDPRAVSAVVVWRPAGARIKTRLRPEEVGRFVAVRLSRYRAPRPAGERWMVTSAAGATLPDGAALVDRGRLLGQLQSPWTGQSLVTPFGSSTRMWTFLLRDAAGAAIEVVGRIVGRTGKRLRVALAWPAKIEAGELFTGCNGAHCPAGFYVGLASPGAGGEMLVEVVDEPILRPEVFLLVDRQPRRAWGKDR